MFSLSKNEIIKKLNSSINGLNETEEKKRLIKNGKNQLSKDKNKSPFYCTYGLLSLRCKK